MFTVTLTSKTGGHCTFSHPDSYVMFEFVAVMVINQNWKLIKATGPDGQDIESLHMGDAEDKS